MYCPIWPNFGSMKCDNVNSIDYICLQESNNPFRTLANKNFLSIMMVNSSATTV